MTQDANSILMGGGGPPAWKFEGPGVRKRATVAAAPTARQERDYDPRFPNQPGEPKVFPSGDPIMGVIVEVQTEERDPSRENDDGRRTFYVEGRRLKEAVRTGIKASGAPGLEVGGVLDVLLESYEQPGDRKSGCNWQVTYTPAANAQLMGGGDVTRQQQQQPGNGGWGQYPPQGAGQTDYPNPAGQWGQPPYQGQQAPPAAAYAPPAGQAGTQQTPPSPAPQAGVQQPPAQPNPADDPNYAAYLAWQESQR